MTRLLSYIPRNSPIHHLDPRVKMLWVVLCSVLSWYIRDPFPMLVLLGFLVLYWVMGQVTAQGIRFALAISPLLIASFVMWNLIGRQGGEAFFSLGFLQLTAGNLALAIAATARILIMSGSFYALLATTDFGAIIAGLTHLRLPYSLAFGVGLSLQLIPLVIQEFTAITDAQRSRGQELDRGNLIERIRKYLAIAVPLLLRSLRLGQNLSFALITYRFGLTPHRTSLYQLKFRTADYCFIAMLLILTLGLILWERNG
ncbi:MAG: energy-coupling factor transporter transmembrane protein EcfT [Oculatellaceae cyanobacterium Prado106]|jgi:energy-coupling factor transport system permease protein|nr:energy-coupling factor transporter transmembrane protein EcfT [Oculatellaceae cyanobacterium Prado106]